MYSDMTNTPGAPLNQWLKKLLSPICVEYDGDITLKESNGQLQLVASGDIDFKMSIFAMLSAYDGHQGQSNMWKEPIEDVILSLDKKELRYAQENEFMLKSVASWLNSQGYDVRPGSKPCATLYTKAKAVKEKNGREVLKEFRISLAVAEAVTKHPGTVKLSLDFSIRTYSDHLMHQLEGMYKFASLKSVDSETGNVNEKQFVVETRGPGEEHLSNISISNAVALWPQFQRLDMVARLTQRLCSDMTDKDEITTIENQLRNMHLAALKKMVDNYQPIPIRQTVESSMSNRRLLTDNNTTTTMVPKLSEKVTEAIRSATGYLCITDGTTRGAMANLEAASQLAIRNNNSAIDTRARTKTDKEFKEELQELLNKDLVYGPVAFKLLHKTRNPYASTLAQMESSIAASGTSASSSSSSSSLMLNSSQAPSTALTVPTQVLVSYATSYASSYSHRVPLELYWIAVGDKMVAQLGSDAARAAQYLIENMDDNTVGDRLEEMRSFLNIHTAYYLVSQVADQFIKNINDGLSDEMITKLLVEILGVSQNNLSFYKVAGMDRYNRYHLVFDMYALVASSFLANDTLMHAGRSYNHPWFKYVAWGQNCTACSKSDWKNGMEFKISEHFKTNWIRGGSAERTDVKQKVTSTVYSGDGGSSTPAPRDALGS